jgi:hypothetical protein
LPDEQICRLYEHNSVPWHDLIVAKNHDTDYQEGLMDYVAEFLIGKGWIDAYKPAMKAAVEHLGGSMAI